MAKFTIKIVEASQEVLHKYNLLDRIIVDNAVDKPNMCSQQYHAGKRKTMKMRGYSDKAIRDILERNGHFSDFKVKQEQDVRRDGVITKAPYIVELITLIPDNRELPDFPVTPLTDGEKSLKKIVQMMSILYNH